MLIFSDFHPAVLKGYKMVFNMRFFGEQAFSGVIKDDCSATHGSLFCMDDINKQDLDNMERGYLKENVTVTTYGGEDIKNVNVYVSPKVQYEKLLVLGISDRNLFSDVDFVVYFQPNKRACSFIGYLAESIFDHRDSRFNS